MIKPQPFELICKQCGWSKTFAPRSDAFIEGHDYVSSCPKRGNSGLERVETKGSAKLIKEINRMFKYNIRRML